MGDRRSITAMADPKLVYKAKLAEQMGRYDDMAKFMCEFAKANTELSVEQYKLLAVGYKNRLGTRRDAWRSAMSIKGKEQSAGGDNVPTIDEYLGDVEDELKNICKEVIELCDKLLQDATNAVSKCFYLKMKADYIAYIAEVSAGEEKTEMVKATTEAYTAAKDLAAGALHVTDPQRIGVALNFSLFTYNTAQDPEGACKLAREGLEAAIPEMENCSEDDYKNSAMIMQLLQDNMRLWLEDNAEGE